VEASQSLSRWLERDVRVSVDSLEQVDLESATGLVGPADETVCACCMRIAGSIQGHLMLSFDDASGFAIRDALIAGQASRGSPSDTAWDEMATSAVLETANIVGCAFLNSLSEHMPRRTEALAVDTPTQACIPSPPIFVRDFAASIMEFVLLDQIDEIDSVLMAKTHFSIEGTPVTWQLLLLPDKQCLNAIAESLG
jgi:chemotaxis protein CheC